MKLKGGVKVSGNYKFNLDNIENVLFCTVAHISKMYDSIKLIKGYVNKTGQRSFSYTKIHDILSKGLNDDEINEIIDQLIWEDIIVEDKEEK
jgi:hypothetical protein